MLRVLPGFARPGAVAEVDPFLAGLRVRLVLPPQFDGLRYHVSGNGPQRLWDHREVAMKNEPGTILEAPAKVLACLRPGYLTVLVGYGLGLAEGGIPHDLPMDLVPFDLRMPNTVFTVLLDRTSGRVIGVER